MTSAPPPRPDDQPRLPSSHRAPSRMRTLTTRAPARIRKLPHYDALAAHRGSVAAIALGVAVIVTASITVPLVGADASSHPTQHDAGTGRGAGTSVAPVSTSASSIARSSAAARPPTRLTRKLTHSSHRASVDRTVISGLAANGIPKVALNAYRVAAARIDHADPGCHLDWWLLAGIGREESDHGQFAGAVLHSDGISTPPIIGPALTGHGNVYIPAPANGAKLDGDSKYAHALGPMQFIPTTWAEYGTDADGDGVANVFDINDAALGAARYLCAAGGNLATHAGRVHAILAYNHSDQYLAQVLALANAYRSGIRVTGIPTGNTHGRLPKLGHGYIPPVNPGPPTANSPHKPRHTKHRGTHAKHSHPKPGGSSSGGSSVSDSGPSSGGSSSVCPSSSGGSGSNTPSSPSSSHSTSASPSSSASPSTTRSSSKHPTASPSGTTTVSGRPDCSPSS